MRKLKNNEIRLFKEIVKLGLYNLPNGAHPTLEDKMFLIRFRNLLKLDNQSINISVNPDFDKKTDTAYVKAQELTRELIELEKLETVLDDLEEPLETKTDYCNRMGFDM